MSAPPNEGYGQNLGQQYDQQAQQPYGDQYAQQDPAAPQQDAAGAQGKKKRRGYAAQAFEVGTGANVPGQSPAGAQQFGAPPAQGAPAFGGGYQADPQAAAGQAYQYPQQGYGAQQPVPAQQPAPYGGYQAPDQGYPGPGAQPAPGAPGAPGVAGITQGMGGMQLGGQPQQGAQPQQAPRPVQLNQLYPTDLLNQPFNVSELDLPPPPIILPPNVRASRIIVPVIRLRANTACARQA